MAHPDDAEILCGGTLTLLSRRGWRVHVATMTAGDCGSAEHSAAEISRIRRREAANAAERLGGTYHCLDVGDLNVFHDAPTQRAVTRLFRTVRPSLVLTHSPVDYHLDHEATSRLARAACFAAPVPLYDADLGQATLEHVPHLYYCDPVEGKDALGADVTPTTVIDVSRVIDEKTGLLACHASQRNWLLKHHGVDEYLSAMRRWSADRGRAYGFEFAEGFRQHLGHGFPQDDLLRAVLA
jgi:LmbE family N-acetylglucosaminyl deacetylase